MKQLHTLFLVASMAAASAATAQQSCAPVQTVVYYGNGVGSGPISSLDDALVARTRLNAAVRQVLSESSQEMYTFKLAYNRSGGTMSDITEAARQTFGNEWPTILVAFLLRDSRILDLLPASTVQQFNDFLTSRAVQQMVAPDLANADLSGQVQSYDSDVTEGKKVVLVSHSQGNIFGNLAYQRLGPATQQHFAMVPVASPESISRKMLAGHVRFADDLVILGVQAARALAGLPGPLAANDEDDVDVEITSHYFTESYLGDSSSRAFIVNAVLQSEALLDAPPNLGAQGAITVTLTWGSNPDVDLHAYEPTNQHVYYGWMNGQFGSLDVDDVTSFGPEHYYVSCQTLRDQPAAIGRYRFGLNYYYGFTPETAQVTVKTPSGERTFTRVLQQARGWGGDNSPVPVADVIVTRDPANGRFDFVIEQR